MNPAKYDVAAGTIRVKGVPGPIPFGPFIGVDPLNLTTIAFTNNSINAAGELVQTADDQATVVGAELRRNTAILQQVQQVDFATVTGIDTARQTSQSQTQALIDMHFFSGPQNQGNDHSPAASDLTLQKAEGITALPGLSAVISPQSPAYQVNAAVPSVAFIMLHRDGLGGFTISFEVTDVPVGFWDNNQTSLSSTPKYVIHQVHFFNDVSLVVPGQNTYDTLSEAMSMLLTEETVHQPNLLAIPNTYRTAVIANGAVTDLNNASFVTPPQGT